MSFPYDNITKPDDLIPYITAPNATNLTDFLKAFDFIYPFLTGSEIAVEMMTEDFVR